jgi:hypothetical protein
MFTVWLNGAPRKSIAYRRDGEAEPMDHNRSVQLLSFMAEQINRVTALLHMSGYYRLMNGR